MTAISSERLLQAWEGTLDEQAPRRGACLLAGYKLDDVGAVAQWSVRDRDRALFDLRSELFGDEAVALATCPRCADHLEVPLYLSLLRPMGGELPPPPFEADGWSAHVRVPTTDDLVAVADADDEDVALETLVERCVESLHRPDGEEATLANAPADVRTLLRLHLAEGVDDVDIELELKCACCGYAFVAPFDIAPFLLREVEAWAARLMREVHLMASAYGWDESTILALSARRRQTYLALIGAT